MIGDENGVIKLEEIPINMLQRNRVGRIKGACQINFKLRENNQLEYSCLCFAKKK